MAQSARSFRRPNAVEHAIRWLIVFALGIGAGSTAAAQEATPIASSTLGLSRAEPVPLGQTAQAGPVELQVLDVLIGPDAVAAILAASPTNVEPIEGSTYVAVELAARNTSDAPLWLDNDDFAITGDSGLVRRYLGAQPPDPALDATLAPGEAATGWVAFGVAADEGSLLLLFDSPEIEGTWADRVFALQDAASIPDAAQRAAPVNDAGADPTAPLGSGEPAVTEQWSVELLDVVSGAPAFDLVDYRTGALGPGDAAGEDGSIWVALRFRIQNVASGGAMAYFPATAFVLVDEAGDPLLDVATLTPPRPDAAGGYYPGAAREGWVMFDVPVGYTANVVRFLPYPHTDQSPDARFFSFG